MMLEPKRLDGSHSTRPIPGDDSEYRARCERLGSPDLGRTD